MKRKKQKILYALLSVSLLACFLFTLGVCFSVLNTTAEAAQNFTVVLDAGHGGIDGGVTGVNTGVKESDINLSIVKKLETCLERSGINVVLTRKTSSGLYGLPVKGFKRRDMEKRKEIIQKTSPVAVISIHQNAFLGSSRRGGQLFYRKDSANGERLANVIQQELNTMPECVKKSTPLAGDYYMLNCTDFTSVICECGFLSSGEDEKLLMSDDYQWKIARAVCRGVLTYFSASASGD